MVAEKFTFRQRWFPTFDDAEKLERVNTGDYDKAGLVQLFGRWTRSLFVGGMLLWTGCQTIGNNLVYSEGQRVGVVNKISEKGLFWKTKEGQLSLEGRTSTGDYTGAGVWDFSIDENNFRKDALYLELSQSMEKGQRVEITYEQLLAT